MEDLGSSSFGGIAMISQPMGGKDEEEIKATREKAITALEAKNYKIVDSYFDFSDEKMKEYGVKQISLYYLAQSLESMSLCDAVYFCKGWKDARGCKIEHDSAVAYGLNIIYEEK